MDNQVRNKKTFIRLYILGAIIFALLTIVVPVFFSRFYSGIFAEPTDPDQSLIRSIILSENNEFASPSPRLNADSIVDEIGIAYASIKLDEILQSEGLYIDPDQKYLSYSFYIRNNGTKTVDVNYYMRLTQVYDNMSAYMRVLIIEDDTIYRMYQKADQPNENNEMPNYNQLPLGIDFESESIVFRDTFEDFKTGEIKRFSVIIWLEEQDPDLTTNHLVGNIGSQLLFSIKEELQVGRSETSLLASVNKEIWIPVTTMCSVDLDISYEVDN